jgi:hypothetical protein
LDPVELTDDLDANLMEKKMRIVSLLGPMAVLAFGVAFAAPSSALAADSAHPFHKHAIETHRAAHPDLSSNAMALAPVQALVPAAPANDSDGLSRNTADCNRGCVDN